MADISKITLPSGTTYDIKDSTARSRIDDIIAAGLSYEVVTTLPEASASTKGKIYLVAHSHGTSDIYDEFLTVQGGTASAPTYSWEKIGNTDIDLSNYVTDVTLNKQTESVLSSNNIARTTTYISGSASGGAVNWDSKDSVTALTGLGTPSTANVVGTGASFSVTQPTINLTSSGVVTSGGLNYIAGVSVTSTNKLETQSIKSVSGTTGVSKMTAATSQTTADGTWTASNVNTNLLANISVSGEVLSIGAATLDTQTTTQWTESEKTVATAGSGNITVATGSITSSGHGSAVVTAVTPTTKYLIASASGGSVAFDSTDSKTAVTGYTPTTDTVIGTDATLSVTQPTIELKNNTTSATGRASALSTVGFHEATVLGQNTSITVTKS